jgi:glycosyltransferase involved in cell wall biosynthesis
MEVTLAIPHPQERGIAAEELVSIHLAQKPDFQVATYHKITVAGRLNILGNYFGARKVLGTACADVSFVRDPLLLHLCISSGLKTVFESHGIYLNEDSRLLNLLWEKDVLSKAKNDKLIKFVTISHALADFWRKKGVPEHKLMVSHDGFNAKLFGSSRIKAEVRQELDLPLGVRIIVYAGSLKPDRHIERIIHLARIFKDTLFVVVGGRKERRLYYENLSRDTGVGNVLWIGHVPHASVASYLQAADVLLMLWSWEVPTITVCSPMKVFEYMASERIIVGEAFPTITEILEDGETALLASPDKFDDLVKNMREALSQNSGSTIASQARELALEKYTWISRAQKILTDLECSV